MPSPAPARPPPYRSAATAVDLAAALAQDRALGTGALVLADAIDARCEALVAVLTRRLSS